MDRLEKQRRLKALLTGISGDEGVESLVRDPVEAVEAVQLGLEGGPDGGIDRAYGRTEAVSLLDDEQLADAANRGLAKLERNESLSEEESFGLEAIVLPRERPVVFVRQNSYGALPAPWSHYTNRDIQKRIEAAILAIGRIELPDHPQIPYGGTGFVVGPDLIMTNRHVAELFSTGLGRRDIRLRSNVPAAINFKREHGDDDDDDRGNLRVLDVVMIHPFWDMALLRVAGLSNRVKPLTLSIKTPEELRGAEVAVVGYPARDSRNNLAVQDRIFQSTYNVKRLQPGKLGSRERIASFGNRVKAVTHDSSTLGGNSGSALIDVRTGTIVGLHFAGQYLLANYAVPSYELARDSRVRDAGVQFDGTVRPTDEWLPAWRLADSNDEAPRADGEPIQIDPNQPSIFPRAVQPPPQFIPAVPIAGTTFTLPLQITVSLGGQMPLPVTQPIIPLQGAMDASTEAPRLQEPIIYDGLEERGGYDPQFLELPDGEETPLPPLTAAGKRAAAKLDDETYELKYHKFSIIMHKRRRMAILTAANVDFRPSKRKVNGRTPTRAELNGTNGAMEKWVTDPRIAERHQLPDVFYTKDGGAFQKGHLVRRDDVCWGDSFQDIQMANGDTFHTTNCSPQVAEFNMSARGAQNWGDLENLISKETRSEKCIVFSGPVLDNDDRRFEGVDHRGEVKIQIPRRYWKIVVVNGAEGPQAFGFVLEQDLSNVDLELNVPVEWQQHLKSLDEIEDLLHGWVSLKALKPYDQAETELGERLEAMTLV